MEADTQPTPTPTPQTAAGAWSLGSLVAWLRTLGDLRRHTQTLQRALTGRRVDWPSVRPYVRLAPTGYRRVQAWAESGFEVVVVTWSAGAESPIHDHDNQACALTPVLGMVEITDWRRVRRVRPGPPRLEPEGPPRLLGPGTVDLVPPCTTGMHAVRIPPGLGLAVTVHIYARPIRTSQVFDPTHFTLARRLLTLDGQGPPLSLPPPPLLTEQLPGNRPAAVAGFTAGSKREGPQAGARPDSRAKKPPERHEEAPSEVEPAVLEAPDPTPTKRPGWLRRFLGRAEYLVPTGARPGQAKLSVTDVEHFYGNDVEALRGVSLDVHSGEFVCLLGPSGCGKSTLLYALAGHISPTGGSVSLDGEQIRGPGPERLLMFQDSALFPWLTVEQNVTFVLDRRMNRAARRERARRHLRSVQLGGFEDAMPHQLSGGMKMRASLARALAVDAPVLLMDEPFGSLDAQTRASMHRLLMSVWTRTHKTIVFVTHDVTEALVLASRLVVMAPRPGRIVHDVELRLGAGRRPDDPALQALARQVHGMLREAEGAPAHAHLDA